MCMGVVAVTFGGVGEGGEWVMHHAITVRSHPWLVA